MPVHTNVPSANPFRGTLKGFLQIGGPHGVGNIPLNCSAHLFYISQMFLDVSQIAKYAFLGITAYKFN